MLSSFKDAFSVYDDVRVVILEGDKEGGAFCAGFDITQIDDQERARGLDPIENAAQAIETCPVPVIAAISGAAFGGGLELACAANIRLCDESARFCMPPAKLGLAYALNGLRRFQRRLSPGQMQRLFLSGEVLEPFEAYSIGLVENLYEDLESSLQELAEKIAKNAPLAVQAMRFIIDAGLSSEAAEKYGALREATLNSNDLREGVAAFQEKRKAQFSGK